MTNPINILCIGEAKDEFTGLEATLAELANVAYAPDLASARALLGNPAPIIHHPSPTTHHPSPDLIVLLQSYPGQFATSEVEQIRRLAPLARWIAVLGTWCEGEARSGQPFAGVTRFYWHQAESQFRREISLLRSGRRSSWSLPVTATDEERLLAVLNEPLPQGSGMVAIHAASRVVADYLSDVCRLVGYEAVAIDPRHPVAVLNAVAAIYDSPALNGSVDDSRELAVLQGIVATIAPAPVFVLASFPRLETVEKLMAIGVRRTLSKPIIITELLCLLGNKPC